jgi:hypothetical protein
MACNSNFRVLKQQQWVKYSIIEQIKEASALNLNGQERAVIEQALKEAINNSGDYQKMIHYREVLTKLQGMPVIDHIAVSANAGGDDLPDDGFRYDYDDSSDVR